jgi:hypothetical protein
MQSDHKQIAKLTAERTGKSEQIFKDIGAFVFTEVQQMFKKPKSLIIKLKGIGNWHLRKKRMEIVVNEYVDNIIDEFTPPSTAIDYKERKERCDMFKERLKEYEEYLVIKKQIRLKRNETQTLLEPDKGED